MTIYTKTFQPRMDTGFAPYGLDMPYRVICYNNPIVIRDLDGHYGDYWGSVGSFFRGIGRAFASIGRSIWRGISAIGRGISHAARSAHNFVKNHIVKPVHNTVKAAFGGGGGGDRSIASSSNTSQIDTPLISKSLSERPTTLWAYWDYSQTTGQLNYVDDQTGATTSIGTGYSGFGLGLNNSDMQNIRNVGPIPQGTYDIGTAYNHRGLGPATMNLDPRQGTNTFDRDVFRMHGDNSRGDQSASRGCIVAPRNVRDRIRNSGDNVLRVVP